MIWHQLLPSIVEIYKFFEFKDDAGNSKEELISYYYKKKDPRRGFSSCINILATAAYFHQPLRANNMNSSFSL